MSKVSVIAVGAIILVVIGGGVWAFSHKNNQAPSSVTPTSTATQTTTGTSNSAPSATDQQSANTITYTDNGFNPATLTVKSGSQVTIKNSSSSILQFDSDPHPEHTDDPELNVGVIAPGHSKTITVTMTGSHGYHNHANADDTGILIVQ